MPFAATARNTEPPSDLSGRYGKQVKLFALDVTDESAAAAAVKSYRYVWLAGRCCQRRGVRQSLVCRRHTFVGFSRANRNEPFRGRSSFVYAAKIAVDGGRSAI
jgi:hypothetical protein